MASSPAPSVSTALLAIPQSHRTHRELEDLRVLGWAAAEERAERHGAALAPFLDVEARCAYSFVKHHFAHDGSSQGERERAYLACVRDAPVGALTARATPETPPAR
jgi:hypothetical protein